MLTFTGKGRTSTCGGVTRRDFLQAGTLGAIGFGLPQWFAAQAAGAVKPGAGDRSCIMIFNLGAPSNMDLWDMKPDAPAEIRGPVQADRDRGRRRSRSPRSCPGTPRSPTSSRSCARSTTAAPRCTTPAGR